ncbi:MAG: hypothetical protein LCI00_20810 [Chloroflexi bacterium]|nr:hypothetical protein [Chloroflexota bacterium]MCC6892451.1 hypothetical protein [Anaerolineae bacterium]
MTFQEIIEEIQHLSVDERKTLMMIISDSLDEVKEHRMLEFQGIGKGLLNGVDAQDYVNTLRYEQVND